MVSIGSSYVNIKPQDAVKRIEELITEIHNAGALAGIHCCGNTDWGMLLKTGIDIINFDAYEFSESISLYPLELKEFLKSGKAIAWGIVPTSKDKQEQKDSLIKRLNKGFDILAQKDILKKNFLETSLITPSCGCGTLSVAESEKVFNLTLEVSDELRKG